MAPRAIFKMSAADSGMFLSYMAVENGKTYCLISVS